MELSLWHLWCIAGTAFCIAEIFTPVLFFLNLGVACIFTGLAAYLGLSLTYQVIIFGVLSALFLLGIRPFLIKKRIAGKAEVMEIYEGKTATVIEAVDKNKGKISLFGEEWQARSINGEIIEAGSYVKIVKNDNIILYVEKNND